MSESNKLEPNGLKSIVEKITGLVIFSIGFAVFLFITNTAWEIAGFLIIPFGLALFQSKIRNKLSVLFIFFGLEVVLLGSSPTSLKAVIPSLSPALIGPFTHLLMTIGFMIAGITAFLTFLRAVIKNYFPQFYSKWQCIGGWEKFAAALTITLSVLAILAANYVPLFIGSTFLSESAKSLLFSPYLYFLSLPTWGFLITGLAGVLIAATVWVHLVRIGSKPLEDGENENPDGEKLLHESQWPHRYASEIAAARVICQEYNKAVADILDQKELYESPAFNIAVNQLSAYLDSFFCKEKIWIKYLKGSQNCSVLSLFLWGTAFNQ